MIRYRKKPVVIDAFQMTLERRWNNFDWPDWLNRAWQMKPGEPGSLYITDPETNGGEALSIGTLEGPQLVSFGDWIIRGVKGEIYPCKPDIFALTYETVVDDDGPVNFSQALEKVKAGTKMQRVGWNGKGMFVFLVPGSTFQVSRAPLLGIYPEGAEINYHAHIDLRTSDGQIVPWVPSQTDMLADDWQEI